MYVWFWIFSKFQLKSPVSNPESNELGQKCNQQHTCPVYSHIQSFPLRINPNANPDAWESTCGVKDFNSGFCHQPTVLSFCTHKTGILFFLMVCNFMHFHTVKKVLNDCCADTLAEIQWTSQGHLCNLTKWDFQWATKNSQTGSHLNMTLKDPSDSLDKHQGSQPYP